MTERPILFNGLMVRAIFERSKMLRAIIDQQTKSQGGVQS
ncbi:UNVERIFIED_ORG: hypothetical protein FHR68_003010 [Xanthomonas campestris]